MLVLARRGFTDLHDPPSTTQPTNKGVPDLKREIGNEISYSRLANCNCILSSSAVLHIWLHNHAVVGGVAGAEDDDRAMGGGRRIIT